MPEVSRFYGIVAKIYLLGKEHNPPHIHFIYGERMASFNLQTLELLEGDLPPKAMALCTQWIAMHKVELLDIWETQVFRKVEPLE